MVSLLQLAGTAILGIGIWTEIDPGQFDAFLGNSGYALPAKILIAAGAFVMVVGFLGCCGAIKESRLLLGMVWYMLYCKSSFFSLYLRETEVLRKKGIFFPCI